MNKLVIAVFLHLLECAFYEAKSNVCCNAEIPIASISGVLYTFICPIHFHVLSSNLVTTESKCACANRIIVNCCLAKYHHNNVLFKCSFHNPMNCVYRFSGLTAENMEGVTTTLRDVQAMLLSMISDKTILIGHSLESDLVALKVSTI